MALAIIARVLRLAEHMAASIPRSNASSLPDMVLRKDIAAMHRILTDIQVAVRDAEERQSVDSSTTLWLAELRALAYDAEDAFDDFNDQLLHPLNDAGPVKLSIEARLPSPPILNPIPMAQRIKDLKERFAELAGKTEALGLGKEGGAGLTDARLWQRSGGLINDESPVFGRDKDKEEILKLLLAPPFEPSRASDLSVLPIVGMAGLGKTTLARLVYNDDQIMNFDARMWIHVSQDFDLTKLTQAMVTCVTGKPCFLSELFSLQSELKKLLEGKCFFLVLDDVWEERINHWESLRVPLLSANKGSKILLTTRNQSVADTMGTMTSYNLEPLKDDDCWSLFCEKAFCDRMPDQRLVKIGKKIVKKCMGVPLTLKAIGLHLRSEEHEDKWSKILESNVWDLSGCQESILPILMLSFIQLPTPVKQCFAYCSIFPKGSRLLRYKVVRMWMAQGFVETDGERKAEDIGAEYFDVLLSRSFFQHCDVKGCFIMHDLIHDLAESISEGECFKGDIALDENGNRMQVDKIYNFPSGVRHSSFTFRLTDCEGGSEGDSEGDLQSLSAAKSLRTLLVKYTSYVKASIPHPHSNVLNDLFMELKYLRVLLLDCTIAPILPDSISNLKFLQYLGVLDMKFKSFPESLCSLRKLQTLEWDSFNVKLPQGISNLINLRHLDGPSCASIPKGIGRLTKLQQFPEFRVSTRQGHARIAELKDLEDLRGQLRLLNLENIIDLEEVMEANMKGKANLTCLDLQWGEYSECDYDKASSILLHLQPHTNIQEVRICAYKDRHLSEWLCHPSYSKLVTIQLRKCILSSLPAFGQLLSLKNLSLEYIEGLRDITPDFFRGGFPSLRKLKLINIDCMVEGFRAEKGQLSHLRELEVTSCYSLKSLMLDNLTSLRELQVSYCPNLQILYAEKSRPFIGIQQHRSLKNLQIVECSKLKFLTEYQIPESLQLLDVTKSALLINWCHRIAGKLKHVQKLRGVNSMLVKLDNIFTVEEARYACLNQQLIHTMHLEWGTSFEPTTGTHDQADDVLECLQPNPRLNKLVIRGYNGINFPEWLSSPSYSNLVSIRLEVSPQCKVLPALGQLPYLMELYLERLHGITSIDFVFYGNSMKKGFQSLRRLELMSMDGLETWNGAPDGEFPSLRHLIIRNCTKLRALPPLSPLLQEIKIENCPELILYVPSSLGSLLDLHVSSISSLKVLDKLDYLSVLFLENCVGHTLGKLPALRNLAMNGCSEKMLLDSLSGLTGLTHLKISCIANLETLPLQNFRALEELVISDCAKLSIICCSSTSSYEPYYFEGLQSLSSCKRITLSDCPELQFSASERLPPAVLSMTISRCPMLRTWYERYYMKFGASGIVFND